MARIDLNCDLGEAPAAAPGGAADPGDEALLGVVTSANVACGGHAGDAATMLATVRAAARRGVAVGAHPSYVDRAHFGRRDLDVDPGELAEQVYRQLAVFDVAGRRAGTRAGHVKPHGALYNRLVHDDVRAGAVLDAVVRLAHECGEEPPAVLGLPGSAVLELASRRGVRAVPEAFADRGYRPDGTLVPRGEPGDVLTDPGAVAARVVAIARGEAVEACDGSPVRVAADSVCVHGDTPGALALARAVRSALVDAGVRVAPVVEDAPRTAGGERE